VFYFFVNGEHSRASSTAFRDEADSLGWARVGQVDQVLAYVGMPVQVVDDVAIATLRLRLGDQLLVEVGMPLQVRVDGLTHVLIALGIRVGHWQRDHRRGGSG
jgi:hypothetical protein